MSPEEWLAKQTPRQPAPTRVSPQIQAVRDSEAVQILQAELTKAQQRAASGDPRAAVDVESITRELSRFGVKPTTPPAAPATAPQPAVTAAALSPEEWLAQQSKAPPPPASVPTADTSVEAPGTTVRGLVGAATRGLAPVATGAALGALVGAPVGGVGAIPGAIAGAGAGTLATVIGDPVVDTINSVFGTNYTKPTQALEDMLTRIGVAQPKTEAERILQSAVGTAASAGGTAAAGKAVEMAAGTAAPVTAAVGRALAAQPGTQVVSGLGAGAASQAAEEAGAGPVGQTVAGLVGGVAGARVVAPRTPTRQLPSDLDDAKRAGIKVMTSDVVPPRTFAQKWTQAVGERIPVVGTGPVRQAQQEQRIQAVKDLANDIGIDDNAILVKNVWDDLANKRSADITKYTNEKTGVITKITRAQSGYAQGEKMLKEANELTQKAGKLYADQARLVNIVEKLKTQGKSNIRDGRIKRYETRINEYRRAIEEAQTAAVQKRNSAQQLTEAVTGKAVDLPRTIKAIDDQIEKLKGMKTSAVQPVISILQDWKASVKGQNLENIELLRKQLGEAFKNPELGSVRTIGQQSVSSIYKPLVEDMGDFIKVNGDRRDYARWKVSNTRLAKLMDDTKGTILETTLKKGDATPEVINQMLFSSKPSEVAQLYRNLSPAGRANARSAIISRAIEKSGGMEHVSPDKFANQVRDLGKSINIFFSGDDLQRVQGLARVLNLTKRASVASVLPPSGVQNFYASLGLTAGAAGGGIKGAAITAAGMATVGGAARLYESAPVRNLLIKIPQTRPGSAEEAELVKRLFNTYAAQQQPVKTPQQEAE